MICASGKNTVLKFTDNRKPNKAVVKSQNTAETINEDSIFHFSADLAVNTIFNQMPPEVGDKVTIEINNVPKGWR